MRDKLLHDLVDAEDADGCIDWLQQKNDLVENYAEIKPKLHAKKRDTPDAQNWPRREAPRPILCAACVAFFASNFSVISMRFSTKSCNNLSLYRSIVAALVLRQNCPLATSSGARTALRVGCYLEDGWLPVLICLQL